jgi:hypothetical protein
MRYFEETRCFLSFERSFFGRCSADVLGARSLTATSFESPVTLRAVMKALSFTGMITLGKTTGGSRHG